MDNPRKNCQSRTGEARAMRKVFQKWPNYNAVAEDLGVKISAVKQMASNNTMRAKYFAPLVRGARRRRITGVSLSLLARIAEESGNNGCE